MKMVPGTISEMVPGTIFEDGGKESSMEIEETIRRESYRDFDLSELRHGNAAKTRWHISRLESGLNHNYGFVNTENEARCKIDNLLRRISEGRKPEVLN
jgi:hypothetical protein